MLSTINGGSIPEGRALASACRAASPGTSLFLCAVPASPSISVSGDVQGEKWEPGRSGALSLSAVTAEEQLHGELEGICPHSSSSQQCPEGAVPCAGHFVSNKTGMGMGGMALASWYLQPLLPGCLLFPEHLPQYSIMAQLILTFFLTK